MENNRVEGAFFFLLKSGLWGKHKHENDFFPLSNTEWSTLYSKGVEQTVEGILYDGLLLLNGENMPPRQLQIKWSVQIDRIERENSSSKILIAEQYAFFIAHDLWPILLKGQGVAATYTSPEHRICGDVDWYFESRVQFVLAQLLLSKIGVPMLKAGSSVYLWKGYEMDLHNRLFDFYNPFSKNILRQSRIDYPDTTLVVGGQKIAVLAPQNQVIQVTAHILKHCLAFGIGLRQFCDLASLYDSYGEELDGRRLERLYSRLGLTAWISAVHQLLVDYIGLPLDKLPFPIRTTVSSLSIIDEVWSSGNFGFYETAYIKDTKDSYIVRKNKTRMLLHRLIKYFPYAPKEALWFPLVHFFTRKSK